MALPGVTVTVRDGGLAIVPPGAGGFFAKIGVSPLGVVNQVYSVADQTALVKALGNGGLLSESGALALVAGGQGSVRPSGLLLVVAGPTTYGSAGSVTHVGSGAGTIVVASRPPCTYLIKCVTAGATGVATFQTSVDGGVTYTPTWTSAATVIVPGVPFHTLAFGSGNAVSGDVYDVSQLTGIGTPRGASTLAVTHSAACPVDAYSVVVTITASGGLGVGQFTYSLDGGTTTSAVFVIPASGTFVIPDGIDPNKAGGNASTGLMLTFANAFVINDTYSFTTTTASYTTTELTNAFNSLNSDTRWSSGNGLHVVGPAATVGAAATLLAALDTLMTSATNNFKFNRAMIEVPTDTDANILAAFVASSSNRVGAAAGYEKQTSSINGRVQSRPAAWQVMARAGSVAAPEPLGRVASGSLPGVISLVRDESITPGLDVGRFTTLTSISGKTGFFITGPGRLMAQGGSDFTFWPYGRVMDLASYYGRNAFLYFLNDTVRCNSDGTLAEKDARRIEQYADQIIRSGLAGMVSDLLVQVSRTNSVLQTQTILPSLRIVPLGMALYINVDIGFTSSALQVKAA